MRAAAAGARDVRDSLPRRVHRPGPCGRLLPDLPRTQVSQGGLHPESAIFLSRKLIQDYYYYDYEL